MEDRSSEREKHKRTQGRMRGGRGDGGGGEREKKNEVRDGMHDIKHKKKESNINMRVYNTYKMCISIKYVQREGMKING